MQVATAQQEFSREKNYESMAICGNFTLERSTKTFITMEMFNISNA